MRHLATDQKYMVTDRLLNFKISKTKLDKAVEGALWKIEWFMSVGALPGEFQALLKGVQIARIKFERTHQSLRAITRPSEKKFQLRKVIVLPDPILS